MEEEQRSILIADDERFVRETLSDLLEREGYRVTAANSGERAMELAVTRRVDAFLLDMEMPGMNGIELCRRIRALPQYKVTPVIFATGSDELDTLTNAFAAGCDDFIFKPFNPVVLRARLRAHIQRFDYFIQLERTRRTMNQYLSNRTLEVVDLASRTGVLPPPQERDLAICFTDIRGFTAYSEEIHPTELFSQVSSLLADHVDLVHEHGGYIDKFGGDGVMALFDGPDMVIQSCLCALRMIESARDKTAPGNEKIWRFGIGIHTGPAVIGNIGSPDHLDYSAIGMSVNLAARLCGQAEATSIAVSKAVRDAVGNDPRLHFYSERSVAIKGMKEPVTVYTLSRSQK